MPLLAPRSIALVALLIPLGAANAETISNWPAATFGGGFGEPIPFTSPGTLPYWGQTFTAPNGTLDSLQLVLEASPPSVSNAGDSVFHVLITEFTGTSDGQLFRPITSCNGQPGVCFESGDITVPLAPLGPTPTEVSIPLGGLALDPGREYFFVLDAWVTRDGVGSDIGVGTRSFPDFPGSPRSNQVDSLDTGATRDEHFAEFWNNTVTGDVAYVLTYTPVPEPGTAALCALGLAALAIARRRAR